VPPVVYLSVADILQAAEHALGFLPEIRDLHLLESAARRPRLRAFGTEAYPALMDKAAALLHSIAAHHLFWDGNKRSATQAAALFLRRNGHEPTWTPQEAHDFVLEVAQSRHDVASIAAWLAQHSAPQDA